jgi:hypothetical protein
MAYFEWLTIAQTLGEGGSGPSRSEADIEGQGGPNEKVTGMHCRRGGVVMGSGSSGKNSPLGWVFQRVEKIFNRDGRGRL